MRDVARASQVVHHLNGAPIWEAVCIGHGGTDGARLELHHECLDARAALPGRSRRGLALPQGFPLFLGNGCRVGADPCSVLPPRGIMPVCVPRLLVVLRFRSILSMISAEISSAFSKLSGVGSI